MEQERERETAIFRLPFPLRYDILVMVQTREELMKPSDAAAYVMPFGKHRGLTLLQIAQQDPTYLDWASDNIRDPVVRDVLITAVEEPTIRRLIERAVYGD